MKFSEFESMAIRTLLSCKVLNDKDQSLNRRETVICIYGLDVYLMLDYPANVSN